MEVGIPFQRRIQPKERRRDVFKQRVIGRLSAQAMVEKLAEKKSNRGFRGVVRQVAIRRSEADIAQRLE